MLPSPTTAVMNFWKLFGRMQWRKTLLLPDGLNMFYCHVVSSRWEKVQRSRWCKNNFEQKTINNRILFFLLSTTFYLIFSHITQHSIQNITKQNNRHILNISRSNQKGGREREGQQKHKSHSFIQSRISNKKHCQASMVEGLAPPTRAVVHSHVTICRRLRIQYVFLHVWCKPVLYYCLLHSCKTSKQH